MSHFQSTRKSRIRYDDIATITARRASRLAERQQDHGRFILAQHRAVGSCVVLLAIRRHPAHLEAEELTSNFHAFRTWRTKQAAQQWAARRPWLDVHTLDAHFLDILPELPPGELPDGKRALDTANPPCHT